MNQQTHYQSPNKQTQFNMLTGLVLQRKCACGRHTTDQHGECTECRKKRTALQRRAVNQWGPETAPPIVHEVLRSAGRPLDPTTRAFMEPRFNHDFSGVQIHTGERAAESARAVNALAYTVGNHVTFGAGQYAPGTSTGRALIGHELTHVVQQRGASTLQPLSISPVESPVEREAAHNIALLASGGEPRTVAKSATSVSRQPVVPPPAPVVPHYRDCTPAITGVADADQRLEDARQRARDFVGTAIARLNNAPAAGTTYETALARHFIAPTAADRATIQATYQNIRNDLVVGNFICNSGAICGTQQAFWRSDDDLLHLCRPFWGRNLTCRAIILIHEAAHDVGIDTGGGHEPNRGDAAYPSGNTAPPGTETTAGRMDNPDAYAFFAAHVWRNTDTGATCF